MDGGSVQLELELVGISATKKRLADLQKFTGRQVDKMKRSFAGLGKSLRGALNNSLANSITGAALFGGLVLGLKNATQAALKFEQVQRKLNITLGESGGAAAFQFASDLAEKYGLSILKTADAMGSFTAAATQAGVSLDDQEKLFTALSKSSVAFGLSQQSTERVFTAVEQIAAKGVVSMEELRQQLGEQLPIAAAAGAKGLGITVKELYGLIETGKLASDEFLPALADGLNELTGDVLDTTTTKIGKFNVALEKLQIAAGSVLLEPLAAGLDQVSKAFEALSVITTAFDIDKLGTLQRILAQTLNAWGSLDPNGPRLDERDDVPNAGQDVQDLADAFKDLGKSEQDVKDLYKSIKESSGLQQGSLQLFVKVAEALGEQTKQRREQNKLNREGIALGQLEAKIADASTDAKRQKIKSSSSIANALFGGNTGTTVEAINQVIAAQKKANAEQQKYETTFNNMDGSREGVAKAVLAGAKAANEQEAAAGVLAIQSEKIRKAFDDASRKVKDIARDLKDAALSLAQVQADGGAGISQFQGSKFARQRQATGQKSILGLAIDARNRAAQDVQSNQGSDAFRDFISRNSNASLKGRSTDQLLNLINSVNAELDAQDQVADTQKKLEVATKDLNGVMQALEKSNFDLVASNVELQTSISDLVTKDWSVRVNVPGADVSGNVIATQNALS